MIFSNLIKSNFLKFISRGKPRSIPICDSPKVLILMNQKIGDMIVCSPILREIKFAYPNADLHVMASEVNKEIALSNPHIDKVYIYNNQWNKLLPILITLRNVNLDIAIELEAKIIMRTILMLKIIRPKCIFAVNKTVGRYGMNPDSVLSYDYYTNPKLKHQRDNALDILRLFNITYTNKSYEVFYSTQQKHKALSFISTFDKSKIIIGLNIQGASEENKILNDDVRQIISGLSLIQDDIIILMLHKPEDRIWISSLINKESSSYTFLSYSTESVLDLAAIVDALDLIITPDTSIVHMACAFHKPLVAIYTNKKDNFERWHPISALNHVIFSNYDDSLKSIDIENVVDKVNKLVKNIKKNSPIDKN